ncbi:MULTISPECIES: hypothetical protein [unclassified Cryobacterium]|nr:MULTISPECIES: hypothetical protein [unclassified Cryobacterium]MDY7556330.1 hypothetical protein [Cryobacterium sp. 10C3]MEB0004472.1 hypothetical protein [Cryobacterium sp. RTC2.1]
MNRWHRPGQTLRALETLGNRNRNRNRMGRLDTNGGLIARGH